MTQAPTNPAETQIPDPSNVQKGEGIPTWRIANGKLMRGTEAKENIEEIDIVLGKLLRIGFQEGRSKDGEFYSHLEVDLETSGGIVRVKTNTSHAGEQKIGVTAISFAKALVMVPANDLIQIEAKLGTKPNKYNKFSTYANLSHVYLDDKKNWRTKWVERYELDKDLTLDQQWEILLSDLKRHPNWKVREMKRDDDEAGGGNGGGEYLAPWDRAAYKAAEPALLQKGWPEFCHGTKDAWLKFASAAAKTAFTSVDDIPESFWTGLVAYLPQAKEVPDVLAAVKVAPAPTPPPATGGFSFGGDDYDPFTDK
jgi:hypothetical protein